MKTQALFHVNSTLPAAELSRLEAQLNAAVMADERNSGGGFKFRIDPAMPTIEDYAKLRPALTPSRDQGTCYAIYLAAIAAGVPEDWAYAAYLICLSS